ncbi:MAG: hypothetical protein IJJ38_00295 [Lachnospiraceae bacterium]|nr:hypothetical protein [Lachnospiraceae bacterium]
MLMTIIVLWMAFGLIRFLLRATWRVTKFFFGVCLFIGCPLLFVLAAMLGVFGTMWLPIVLFGLFYAFCFHRC